MRGLLHEGVAFQAHQRPDATAIVWRDTRVTYRELDDASSRLANMLVAHGCARGDRVALLMPKLPVAIEALLGVLKADAIYVPFDPASPPARLARMLESSACRAILAAGAVGSTLAATLALAQLETPPLVGWLDPAPPTALPAPPAFTLADCATYPSAPPRPMNTEADIAHILFTSGSTGIPKGVMITHRNVNAFLRWAIPYFGIGPTDRMSQHPALHFDLSTFDIFGALTTGAALHLVPAELALLPPKLAAFIRESRLTQWFSVPSVLNLMAKFDVLAQDDFPELRRVLWCGEAIPTPTVIHWMQRLPHATFTNLYGPTEATIASSYYTLPACPDDPRVAVPIGTACAGESLLVLDAALQRVPPDTTGALFIGGAGLSPGYWRDPEKTADAFLPDPRGADTADRIYRTGDLARRSADGLFHFLGRADTQIKSRGYRIELGEIESALACLPYLRESAVVAIPADGFEGWTLCCAFAAFEAAAPTAAVLRSALAEKLPAYMLPNRWMRYTALPKNANGKIDRPQLKADFAAGVAPNAAVPAAWPERDAVPSAPLPSAAHTAPEPQDALICRTAQS